MKSLSRLWRRHPVARPWLRGGGIGAALTGFLADRFGLLRSLELLVLLPLVAALFCLGLPRRKDG